MQQIQREKRYHKLNNKATEKRVTNPNGMKKFKTWQGKNRSKTQCKTYNGINGNAQQAKSRVQNENKRLKHETKRQVEATTTSKTQWRNPKKTQVNPNDMNTHHTQLKRNWKLKMESEMEIQNGYTSQTTTEWERSKSSNPITL